MEAVFFDRSANNPMEPKWGKMLSFSLVFHLAAFSLILFVPDQIPTRRIRGPVYEVNLVELPKGKSVVKKGGAKTKTKPKKSVHRPAKAVSAKRIARPKKKAKPIVVAKRTVKTKRAKKKKAEVATSKLIDEALSKIEKRVQEEEKSLKEEEKGLKEEQHVEQAISDLEGQVKEISGQGGQVDEGVQGGGGGFSDTGIYFSIYQMEVANRIKSNWTYPVAELTNKDKSKLEAVVIVKVKSDGSILKSWLKKRSSDVVFDQSVLKAVERSNPLPPFPEGYRKTHDEIEFTFNLKDLEQY